MYVTLGSCMHRNYITLYCYTILCCVITIMAITVANLIVMKITRQYSFCFLLQNKGYVPLPQAVDPSQQAYPPQNSDCSSQQPASLTQGHIPQQPLSEVIGEFFC